MEQFIHRYLSLYVWFSLKEKINFFGFNMFFQCFLKLQWELLNLLMVQVYPVYHIHYYEIKDIKLIGSLGPKIDQAFDEMCKHSIFYKNFPFIVFSKVVLPMHKTWSFSLKTSSVNVTKSAASFFHIYWRNP